MHEWYLHICLLGPFRFSESEISNSVLEARLRDILIAAGHSIEDGRRQSHWNSRQQQCASEFVSFLMKQLGFRGWNKSQSSFHASDLDVVESALQDSECDMALWCVLVKETKHNAAHSTRTIEVGYQFTVQVQSLPSGSSLDELLAAMQSETLHQFNCSPCNTFHANATMQHSCHSPSAPLLMFHLQRYNWNEPKIATDVDIPEFLHFCEWEWELIVVVCHIGTLPTNGHYVAHIKSNNHWLLADDMEIQQEDFHSVRQSAAQDGLLLLYRKRGIDFVPSVPSQPLVPTEVGTVNQSQLDVANPIDATDPFIDQHTESVEAPQASNANLSSTRSTWLKCDEVKAVQEYMKQHPDISVSKACEFVGVARSTYYK